MERYINISPTVFNGADLEGAVKKKRSRVERSPSALSDGGAMAARAQTDLSDSSVNNQAADASKKGSDIFLLCQILSASRLYTVTLGDVIDPEFYIGNYRFLNLFTTAIGFKNYRIEAVNSIGTGTLPKVNTLTHKSHRSLLRCMVVY